MTPEYLRQRPSKALTRVMSMALFEGRALLQRGRWINPLVFAHMAVEKRLPAMKLVRKPIFVTGTGRSGTTILGLTLSYHRNVGFLNEPKGMWYAACPSEDIIGSYGSGPAKYRLTAEDVTPEIETNIRRLYGAYLFLTGASRICDKSDWAFRIAFLKKIFPDATFLITVRNGWDTCRSVEKWSKEYSESANGYVADWWGRDSRRWKLLVDQILTHDPVFEPVLDTIRSFDSQTDRAIVEWIAVMREAQKMAASMPDCVKLVEFERLSCDPRAVLGEIAAFCALENDRSFIDFGEHVFKPVPKRDTFDFSPALRGLFDETMSEMGYA